MRYLFCTDITNNINNETTDGECLQTGSLPQTMREQLRQESIAYGRTMRRFRLPKALRWVKYIAFVLALIILRGILDADVSFGQGYRNAPFLYWAGAGLIALAAVLQITEWRLKSALKKNESALDADRRMSAALQSVRSYLGVPDECCDVDLLLGEYATNGTAVTFPTGALNAELQLYRKGEALCVFDGSEVYSLPLNELTGLRVIEEPVSVVGWNKEGSPKHKQFLDSGVILSRDTINGLKFFCALELRHDSEDYALLFPPYELPVVAQLTGLNAPELPPVNLRERRAQGKRELEPVAPPPEDGRIHPMFYWHFPGFQKVAYWCTPGADVSFHSKHPVAYVLLLTLGLIVFCLPWLAFAVGVRYLLPEAWDSGWMWLGVAGGFVAGVGLFNFIGAWLHQYLGHVFTLLCVGGGTLMMAVSLLLLA